MVGFEALGLGLEADRKGIVGLDVLAFSFLFDPCRLEPHASRLHKQLQTYHQVADVLDQSSRQYVEQIIHT